MPAVCFPSSVIGVRGGRGRGTHVMHGRSRVSMRSKPSYSYVARTEHVGFAPTRQALLASSAKRTMRGGQGCQGCGRGTSAVLPPNVRPFNFPPLSFGGEGGGRECGGIVIIRRHQTAHGTPWEPCWRENYASFLPPPKKKNPMM